MFQLKWLIFWGVAYYMINFYNINLRVAALAFLFFFTEFTDTDFRIAFRKALIQHEFL